MARGLIVCKAENAQKRTPAKRNSAGVALTSPGYFGRDAKTVGRRANPLARIGTRAHP